VPSIGCFSSFNNQTMMASTSKLSLNNTAGNINLEKSRDHFLNHTGSNLNLSGVLGSAT